MLIVKPEWVSHYDSKKNRQCIFSIDFHPSGTRFATGGLDFKIKIWNFTPLMNESQQNDPSVHKLLCVLSRHDGAVNCVRFSNGFGVYLASGSDDKIVMIWQLNKSGEELSSKVFETGEYVANLEQWTCVHRLTGHAADVMDLAWSPDNLYLASCGLDSTIFIWDTKKFAPLKKLQGHNNFVKGITWDPVGKYLASQSDDKKVIIWRVDDWKIEKSLVGPFTQSTGTAFFYRLNWSPDGGCIATAHAFNNNVPVSTLINRDNWSSDKSLVGHSAPIVTTRFSPAIYRRKNEDEHGEELVKFYTMCAVGSEDHTLSIWASESSRPLAVIKGLFDHAVLDLSWTLDGTRLLACSYDGNVAYIELNKEEYGDTLPFHEKERLLEKYGLKRKGITIPEGSVQLDLENIAKSLESKRKPLELRTLPESMTSSRPNMPLHSLQKQVETRTKEGRKRITPQLVRTFNDTRIDTILSESQNHVLPLTDLATVSNKPFTDISVSQTTVERSSQENLEFDVEQRVREFNNSNILRKRSSFLDSNASSMPSPSKKKSRSKPLKYKDEDISHSLESKLLNDTSKVPQTMSNGAMTTTSIDSTMISPHLITASFFDPIEKQPIVTATIRHKGSNLIGTIEADNRSNQGSKISFIQGGNCIWQDYLPLKVISLVATERFIAITCEESHLLILSPAGRRIFPCISLENQISSLSAYEFYLALLLVDGRFILWNFSEKRCVAYNFLPSTIRTKTITSFSIEEEEVVIVSCTDGHSYCYDLSMNCWYKLTDQSFMVSDFISSLCTDDRNLGLLGLLQNKMQQTHGNLVSQNIFKLDSLSQHAYTIAHLESQLCSALILKSRHEYQYWLRIYVRRLTEENCVLKLRELCDDLSTPSSKVTSLESLGLSKRELLQEVLLIMTTNRQLQRLVEEYREGEELMKES